MASRLVQERQEHAGSATLLTELPRMREESPAPATCPVRGRDPRAARSIGTDPLPLRMTKRCPDSPVGYVASAPLTMSIEIGILLALACALATNVSVPREAPRGGRGARRRHPPPAALGGRPVPLALVRNRHGDRRVRVAAARRRHRARADVTRPGRARRRRRDDRRDGRPPVRPVGRHAPMARRRAHRDRPRDARGHDAEVRGCPRGVLARPDDRLRARPAGDRRRADHGQAAARQLPQAGRRAARHGLGDPLRRLRRRGQGADRPGRRRRRARSSRPGPRSR